MGSRIRSCAALLAPVLLTFGCGTRVHDSGSASAVSSGQFNAAPAAVQDLPASEGATVPVSQSGAPLSGQASAVQGATGAVPGAGSTAARPAAGTGAGKAQSGTAAAPQGGQPKAGGTAAPAGQRGPESPTTPAVGSGTAPQGGSRSPVILGSLGTYSGPAGTVLAPLLRGAQLWVKYINAKGGLAGHQVGLRIYDDSGDPARHKALAQQAVEKDRVIAFLMNGETVTGAGKVDYVQSKRVPVIGTPGGEPWADKSPMYFEQASNDMAAYFALLHGMAMQAVPAGKTKLGALLCVEVETCRGLDKTFTKRAKAEGMDYVFKANVTITQPDFTAECLSARNAGVQVLFLAFDQNSQRRAASSCARQGYRPIYAAVAGTVDTNFKDDPNFDGLITASTVFPYFGSYSPATQDFHQAVAAFDPGAAAGSGPTLGWVAGKVLEKAVANVGLSEPPTSEAILNGLWSIKGDDLDGLTMPLTFVKDQPAAPQACAFNWTIRKGAWVSPDGFQRQCLQNVDFSR